jgi:hypothetical protein
MAFKEVTQGTGREHGIADPGGGDEEQAHGAAL